MDMHAQLERTYKEMDGQQDFGIWSLGGSKAPTLTVSTSVNSFPSRTRPASQEQSRPRDDNDNNHEHDQDEEMETVEDVDETASSPPGPNRSSPPRQHGLRSQVSMDALPSLASAEASTFTSSMLRTPTQTRKPSESTLQETDSTPKATVRDRDCGSRQAVSSATSRTGHGGVDPDESGSISREDMWYGHAPRSSAHSHDAYIPATVVQNIVRQDLQNYYATHERPTQSRRVDTDDPSDSHPAVSPTTPRAKARIPPPIITGRQEISGLNKDSTNDVLQEHGVITLGSGFAGGPQVLAKPPLWRRRAKGEESSVDHLSLVTSPGFRRSCSIKSPLSALSPRSSQLSPVSALWSNARSALVSSKPGLSPITMMPELSPLSPYTSAAVQRGFASHERSESDTSFASVSEPYLPLTTRVPLDLNRSSGPLPPWRPGPSAQSNPSHQSTSEGTSSSGTVSGKRVMFGEPPSKHVYIADPEEQENEEDEAGSLDDEEALDDLDLWRRRVARPPAIQVDAAEYNACAERFERERKRASAYRRISMFGARDITAEHGLEQGDEDDYVEEEKDLYERVAGPNITVYSGQAPWDTGGEGKGKKKGVFGKWKRKLSKTGITPGSQASSKGRPRRGSACSSERSFEAPERYTPDRNSQHWEPERLPSPFDRDHGEGLRRSSEPTPSALDTPAALPPPSFIRHRPGSVKQRRRVSLNVGDTAWAKRLSRLTEGEEDRSAGSNKAERRLSIIARVRAARCTSEAKTGKASIESKPPVKSTTTTSSSNDTATLGVEDVSVDVHRRSVIEMHDLVPFPVPPARSVSSPDFDDQYNTRGLSAAPAWEYDDIEYRPSDSGHYTDAGVPSLCHHESTPTSPEPSTILQTPMTKLAEQVDQPADYPSRSDMHSPSDASFYSAGEGTMEDMAESVSLSKTMSRLSDISGLEHGESGGVVVGQAVRISVYAPEVSRKASIYTIDEIRNSPMMPSPSWLAARGGTGLTNGLGMSVNVNGAENGAGQGANVLGGGAGAGGQAKGGASGGPKRRNVGARV